MLAFRRALDESNPSQYLRRLSSWPRSRLSVCTKGYLFLLLGPARPHAPRPSLGLGSLVHSFQATALRDGFLLSDPFAKLSLARIAITVTLSAEAAPWQRWRMEAPPHSLHLDFCLPWEQGMKISKTFQISKTKGKIT
jgi:hypothetical protein